MGNSDPRREAFTAGLVTLFAQYPATGHDFAYWRHIAMDVCTGILTYKAHYALGYAMDTGVPNDELTALYALIYPDGIRW